MGGQLLPSLAVTKLAISIEIINSVFKTNRERRRYRSQLPITVETKLLAGQPLVFVLDFFA